MNCYKCNCDISKVKPQKKDNQYVLPCPDCGSETVVDRIHYKRYGINEEKDSN